MTKKNIEKTWVEGGSRGTTTFNAPGTLTIPYGRYKGTLDGRGGTGGANTAATWNTNYNVVYPIATQPIANQPAATWNTNYNVIYPIATQPIANQPAATWNTNYNVAYPIANRPVTAHGHFCGGVVGWYALVQEWSRWTTYQEEGVILAGDWQHFPPCHDVYNGGGEFDQWWHVTDHYEVPTTWSTNYNVVYPIANAPIATWNTNYNTNYNVAYPIANRPAATWNTNYNTNYNVAYPIANRPAATWNTNYNTNYNVAYPIANRPAATWNTNYNTNYNVVYPIANQPIATYSVGPAGTPITIFGVTMPGAPGGGSTATPIAPTPISYYTKPDGSAGEPDNASYPVTVPTGGQIIFKIE